jgi:hypothetical protein
MAARTKRTRDVVIDLTADSSDVESDQQQRKAVRWRLSVNRPSQIFSRTWVKVEDEDEGDADDIIDLTQEVDNNGIDFVGRIGIEFA